MTHHVPVSQVAANESIPAGGDRRDDPVRNLRRLHPGRLLIRPDIGGHLFPGFQFLGKLLGSVSVPEIGHMAKLLGFGTGIFIDAVFHQQFGQRMRKLRRIDQVVLRDMLIPVIF